MSGHVTLCVTGRFNVMRYVYILQESAKHYALSAELERPFSFDGKDSFVVQ